MNKINWRDVAILTLAILIGGGGLLTFMLFLLTGPLNLLDLGLSEASALLFDAFLCLAFFLQHSVMPRKPVRQWLAVFLPAKYSGAVYAITSGIVALALVLLWQESAYTLLTPQGLVRWSFRVIFVLSVAGVAWTIWAIGIFVNFRLKPLTDDLRGIESQPVPLVVRGPYRWIRHPLYLSAILMIWSYPDLTLDRLLFNVLFTVWVIVGIVLEERDLVALYGEAYHDYQHRVPMLFPRSIRPI